MPPRGPVQNAASPGPDFRKLWIGQSIPFLGSRITPVALSLAGPRERLDRVPAVAAAPVGGLAGGYLAAGVGTRVTLWIAASGVMLSTLWALGSRLRVTGALE